MPLVFVEESAAGGEERCAIPILKLWYAKNCRRGLCAQGAMHQGNRTPPTNGHVTKLQLVSGVIRGDRNAGSDC